MLWSKADNLQLKQVWKRLTGPQSSLKLKLFSHFWNYLRVQQSVTDLSPGISGRVGTTLCNQIKGLHFLIWLQGQSSQQVLLLELTKGSDLGTILTNSCKLTGFGGIAVNHFIFFQNITNRKKNRIQSVKRDKVISQERRTTTLNSQSSCHHFPFSVKLGYKWGGKTNVDKKEST